MSTTQKMPMRFLTNDETINLVDRLGDDRTFRVRIWQGADAVPIVLATMPSGVTATNPFANPSSMSSKIANFVNAAILRYPVLGFIYFEADSRDEGSCEHVLFSYFGAAAARVAMYKPTRIEHKWSSLELIVGEEIER